MHFKHIHLLGASVYASVSFVQQYPSQIFWKSQQSSRLEKSSTWKDRGQFTVPAEAKVSSVRALEVERKRQGYLYGPSLIGNTSYFPMGFLGDAMVQQHIEEWLQDAAWVTGVVEEEAESAAAALNMASSISRLKYILSNLSQAGGLKNLGDYQILYENQWKRSSPYGIVQGALTNSTGDLFFSMERLSVNPYSVRRLHPTADVLAFEIDSVISRKITGVDVHTLHRTGRLFYVDHSYQAHYPTIAGKYTAACSAFFYLHPVSSQFLPLAIKTNVGSDLIYTPLDDENDWLLAKMMFNMNDLFHGQIFHLANSHAISEVVNLAALRTLSSEHPMMGLLDRLMRQAYAIRPIGEKVLFNTGGYFDQSFAITNDGVRQFATDFYHTIAGPFQANYFQRDLVKRGLLNCTYGPALRSFPFLEDASVIHSSIQKFMASFVEEYYETEDKLSQDHELQSWIRETTSGALAIDFPPSPLKCQDTLVDILTHITFLAGVSHHVLNSGEPVTTSGVLPFHPSAIYAPPPAEKGISDLMPYLTPGDEAVKHIALLARFNRPQLEERGDTLLNMFTSEGFLSRYREETQNAASIFHQEMRAFSNEIRQRHFDVEGLSQGMPFVWQALDPARIPFFLSV